MTQRTGLLILAASALLDLALVLLWGSPSVGAAVLVVMLRLLVPIVGVMTRRRWILYAGALVALACQVVFWIIVFLTPAVPIACLVVARRIDTTTAIGGETATSDSSG